eukprot:2419356-Pyramimonas_sp.AAC.1
MPAVPGAAWPIAASALAPCLIFVWRAKFAALPPAARPAGPRQPFGPCTPSSFSTARGREPV